MDMGYLLYLYIVGLIVTLYVAWSIGEHGKTLFGLCVFWPITVSIIGIKLLIESFIDAIIRITT